MIATEAEIQVKFEWREDGRYGYRYLSVSEIPEFFPRDRLGMHDRVSSQTPQGEITMALDTIYWYEPTRHFSRTWEVSLCAVSDFSDLTRRMNAGESFHDLFPG